MAKMSSFKQKDQKEEISEAPQVEELLKNLEFHNAIQDITSRILNAETLREIVVDIRKDIQKLFNIHILTIYIIDKGAREIFTLQSDGSETRFPIDSSTFPGWVAQKKKLLHVADAYNDRDIRRFSDTLSFDRTLDKKTGILTGQIIASPILRDGLIMGVMEIMNKKGGDKIDDYNQIFLDEISVALARAFYLHLNFAEAKKKYGAKFESLVQKGILTSDQMDVAIRQTSDTRSDLAGFLMEQYRVSKEDIGQALAHYYKCPFTAYNSDLPIPTDLLTGIGKNALISALWTPLKVVKGKIHVITADPSDYIRKKKIEEILETSSIQYEVAIPDDILKFIHRFYDSDSEQTEENIHPVPAEKKQPLLAENHIDRFDISTDLPEPDREVILEGPFSPLNNIVTLSVADEFTDEKIVSVQRKIEPSEVIESQKDSKRVETPLSPSASADLSDIEALAAIKPQRLSRPATRQTHPHDLLPEPLTSVIYRAMGRRATDIHFEPDPVIDSVNVRLRVDGQIIAGEPIAGRDYEKLLSQTKQLARLDASAHILQNGDMTLTRPSGKDIPMHVTCIPTSAGLEDLVIRLSGLPGKLPLELLGLSEDQYALLCNILQQPRGLILVVGPQASGITTTLHACLSFLSTPEVKVWAAEDPIEIVNNAIRQVRIDPDQGLSFPAVLKSFLSADADVIMASRIDSAQTASICMQAAVKGRLVLSSLLAPTIPDAIEKSLSLDPDGLMFADAALAIVEQRLIKTLCPKCKEKYHPSQPEYEELAQAYGKEAFDTLNIPYSNSLNFFRPKGCEACGQTGYAGRACVSEIFVFAPPIKRMIRRKDSPEAIYSAGVSSGMTTLIQDGVRKVFEGYSDARHVRLTCLK